MVSNLLYVAVGGCMGAVMRYLVATYVQASAALGVFPIGTLTVNIMGCFLFGLLGSLSLTSSLFSAQTRLLVFTGFLGSFTTYSTFGNDSIALAQDVRYSEAMIYVLLHLGGGFGAVLLGQFIGQRIGPT